MSCCSFIGGFGGGGGSSGAAFSTYVLPEQWAQNNVVDSQVDVALECQLSTDFDTYKVLKSGSITGLSTRLTEAVLTGTLTVEVTINGAGTGLLINHSAGSDPSGGVVNQAIGTDTYVADDLLGIRISTTADFTPITTDLEAMIQVSEL
jgi:hypothetical protein